MIKNFASNNSNAFNDATFIFLNTLHLKADFASDTFNKKDTKEEVFHNIDGTEGNEGFIRYHWQKRSYGCWSGYAFLLRRAVYLRGVGAQFEQFI